jgi:hypothetical protein
VYADTLRPDEIEDLEPYGRAERAQGGCHCRIVVAAAGGLMVAFLVKGKRRLGQNASASRGCYSVLETPAFKTRFGFGPFARILAAPRQAPRQAPSAYPTASADPAPADGMHQRAGRPAEADMGIRLL